MTDGPYCRVYWTVMSDEKFDGIRENPAHFGAWLTLLVVADMAWPAPAFLPPSVPKRVVALLENKGLIVTLPGWRFKVKGLDAERSGRSDKARDASEARWAKHRHSGSNAPSIPPSNAKPVLAKQSRAEQEQSTARDGLPNLDDAVAQLWQDATGRSVISSGNYAASYLDDACLRHGPTKVGVAVVRARKSFDHIPDAPSMVSAMRPILDPLPDRKKVGEAERAAEERAASRRRTAATLENIHRNGGHEAKPRPGCPMCEAVTA